MPFFDSGGPVPEGTSSFLGPHPDCAAKVDPDISFPRPFNLGVPGPQATDFQG